MIYKTTNKQFVQFKKECNRWIKFWGLTEWSVVFFHEKINDDCYADCTWNVEGRVASIRLNKEIDGMVLFDPKKTAFHEVCELLLCELDGLARDRFISKSHISIAFHAVIRRLENCVYEKSK